MAADEPTRRIFTGSCHCQKTRFTVALTVPPPEPLLERTATPLQRLYRCNCTVCHKAGLIHVRPPHPSSDFRLLSPLSPSTELGDYTCNGNRIHWFFCKTCGVRCFSFAGEGEVVEEEEGGGKSFWRVKKEGEGKAYLSVNGHAIDAEQEGFDLRDWTEGKKLAYLNYLTDDLEKRIPSSERPPSGGCY